MSIGIFNYHFNTILYLSVILMLNIFTVKISLEKKLIIVDEEYEVSYKIHCA